MVQRYKIISILNHFWAKIYDISEKLAGYGHRNRHDAITLLRYYTTSFGKCVLRDSGVLLILYFIYIIIYIKLIIYIYKLR